MFIKAIVTFSNGIISHNLIYDLNDSELSQKWAARVIEEKRRGLKVYEGGWFHGFPNQRLTGDTTKIMSRKTLADQMNGYVEIINQYYPDSIPERAHEDMTQDELNVLHHYFELYRGPVDKPRFMWVEGNTELRNALEKLNEIIHRFEAFVRNSTDVKPRISVMHRHDDFNIRRKTFLLDDGDYNFHPNRYFGQLYLKYCTVGKQVLDVFFDQDNEIFDDNVVPLNKYSSDYDMYFGEAWSKETEENIMNDLKVFLDEKNLDIDDKKLSLGFCTMAELNREESGFENMSNDEIRDFLFGFNEITDTNMVFLQQNT